MNLPRMITALTAAHACMTDKKNWREEGDAHAFYISRANEIINRECACTLFAEGDQSLGVIIIAVITRHQCPDHRVYELAHFLYHMLGETDMASTNLQ